MFKTIPIIVMATLCLNFIAIAQDNKAIDVTTKGIQIGQKVPNITITNLHNYKDKDGRPATTAKLSDFKGKLLILDFWATWCSPCVAMIPKMDSLQKQFKGRIQFLSVTYQSDKDVLPFLEKYEKKKGKEYHLPLITGDNELRKLFPHVKIPHYVWVDASGTVKAVTGGEQVSDANISDLIVGKQIALKQKRDMKIAYDNTKAFLINGNGGNGDNLIFHSILTGYQHGLYSEYHHEVDEKTQAFKATYMNVSPFILFMDAYSSKTRKFNQKNSQILVRDSSLIPFNTKSSYCYEQIIPSSAYDDHYKIMRTNIGQYFPQFTAKITVLKRKCLILIRTTTEDRLKSSGGNRLVKISKLDCTILNAPLSSFVNQLSTYYLQKYPFPIIDGTNYENNVDFHFTQDMTNINSINAGLMKYGLKLREEVRETEILVIQDRIKPSVNKYESSL